MSHESAQKDGVYYVLFGFNRDDEDETGYLRIAEDSTSGRCGIYDVVDNHECASHFDKETIEKVSKLVLDEDTGIEHWKFHRVKLHKNLSSVS